MPVLLCFKVMAVLTWWEVFCFENVQIAYCVIYRSIPGSWVLLPTKRIFVIVTVTWVGHFLCGVEMVKRFVKVHLHCIVSNLKIITKCRRCPPWKNSCGRPWPWVSSRSKSSSSLQCKTPQYRVRKCVHEGKPRATNRSRVNPITVQCKVGNCKKFENLLRALGLWYCESWGIGENEKVKADSTTERCF